MTADRRARALAIPRFELVPHLPHRRRETAEREAAFEQPRLREHPEGPREPAGGGLARQRSDDGRDRDNGDEEGAVRDEQIGRHPIGPAPAEGDQPADPGDRVEAARRISQQEIEGHREQQHTHGANGV